MVSPTAEEQRLLDAVRSLRDEARLVSDRLGVVWEEASLEGAWVADDALVAYRVAEARWQGLNQAVREMESVSRRPH